MAQERDRAPKQSPGKPDQSKEDNENSNRGPNGKKDAKNHVRLRRLSVACTVRGWRCKHQFLKGANVRN